MFDLDTSYMKRTPQAPVLKQSYSMGYWLYWRACNACKGQGWRTLFRGNQDHTALVMSGKTDLGTEGSPGCEFLK